KKWLIYPADTSVAKIPKSVKPDFEAMENIGDSVLLIFGSGSKSPERDKFIRILPDDPDTIETISLTEFYSHLKKQTSLQNQELNIEGVTVRKNKIFLFNRFPAVIFELDYDAFLAYISGGPLPGVRSKSYKLPSIDGTRAGFS